MFLEAVGFILAEFELKRSHGARQFLRILDTRAGAAVSAREISVSEREISVSERERERETYLCLRFYIVVEYIYIYI